MASRKDMREAEFQRDRAEAVAPLQCFAGATSPRSNPEDCRGAAGNPLGGLPVREEAMRAQSDMQRRQLRMDADGTIHEGGRVRLEGEGIQAVSEANLSAQAQRNAVEHDAKAANQRFAGLPLGRLPTVESCGFGRGTGETRAQANGAGRGAICQLIAAYVRALEGISYREWGIVVDIMEHAFERRQREYMLDLRFDADDEVAKEIMRAGAAR